MKKGVVLGSLLLILFLGIFISLKLNPIKMTGNVVTNINLVEAGFDPGMKIARISTAYRGHKYDFDSCLDLSNNNCYGNVAAGSGFYSLEPYFGNTGNFDNECHINSMENYTYYYSWSGAVQTNVPCPYYFNWKTENQNFVADLKIDSSKFKKAEDSYFMLNLQETGHKSNLLWNQYWGIKENWQNDYNTFPLIKNLSKITFDLRSKICYESTKDDGIRIGRTYYYFTVYDSSKKGWQTIALDLFNFKKAPVGSSWYADNNLITKNVSFEDDLAGCTTVDCSNQQDRWRIIQVNAKYLGVLDYSPYIDSTLDCSVPIENVRWTKVDIDVQKLLNDLVNLGFVNQSLLENGRFVSRISDDSLVYNQNWPQYQTIDLGMETYGRFSLESQIKNRTLWVEGSIPPIISTCTSFIYSPWTQCNYSAMQSRTITSQSPSGCNDGNSESLIQQCSPPCLESNWQLADSTCLSSNTLTRTWNKIGNCNQTIGINKIASENVACTYLPNVITCTNFTYSNWSECFANGIQNRSLTNSFPENCTGGNPTIAQTCNYTLAFNQDDTLPITEQNIPSGSPSNDVNNNNNTNTEGNVTPENISTEFNNQTIKLGENKTPSNPLKRFFVTIICRISNLFNNSKYSTCVNDYLEN